MVDGVLFIFDLLILYQNVLHFCFAHYQHCLLFSISLPRVKYIQVDFMSALGIAISGLCSANEDFQTGIEAFRSKTKVFDC